VGVDENLELMRCALSSNNLNCRRSHSEELRQFQPKAIVFITKG
jgi:hypothetical protein